MPEKKERKVDLAESLSPIDVLLSLDEKALIIEKKVFIKRLNSFWTVRSITQDEFEIIATRSVGREMTNGRSRMTTNATKQNGLTIYYGTINPNLRDPRLYEKFKIDQTKSEDLVNKILLPGEIVDLVREISLLSGFGESFNQLVEESENL